MSSVFTQTTKVDLLTLNGQLATVHSQDNRVAERKSFNKQYDEERAEAVQIDRHSLNKAEIRSKDIQREYSDARSHGVLPKDRINTQYPAAGSPLTKNEMPLEHLDGQVHTVFPQSDVPPSSCGNPMFSSKEDTSADIASEQKTPFPLPVMLLPAGKGIAPPNNVVLLKAAISNPFTIFTAAGNKASLFNPSKDGAFDAKEESRGKQEQKKDKEQPKGKQKTPFAALTALLPPRTENSERDIESTISGIGSERGTAFFTAVSRPPHSGIMQRVYTACEAAAANNTLVKMKLNLEHLGTLLLRFQPGTNKLTLRFQTPSKESAEFIKNHLCELKTYLKGQKVVLEEHYSVVS